MNNPWYIVFGSGLALVGGTINNEFRAWRDRSNERKAIKISFVDELTEIELAIKSMHDVWDQTKIFSPAYVEDLKSNTSSYDSFRLRLFLIKDVKLRRKIVAFYKKIKDTSKKSEGKGGTLAETDEVKKEQADLEASFQVLGKEAKEIRECLE